MTTLTIKGTNASGGAIAHIPLFDDPASTFHQPGEQVPLNAVAAISGIQDVYSEIEWHHIVNKPSVRQALRRMATEARRQYYAGETEEGGFAVE